MWLWCLCVCRNCFIGLDLPFHNYPMGRLIVAKYYKNFKCKITIEVQRTTRNFTTFMFICFWHFLLFSQSPRGSAICIFHPVVMNYKKGCGSQLWISFSFGVCRPVFNVIPCCSCGFLSSTSTAFAWRAFSKIKHLPHWQHFRTLSAKLLTYRRHKASFLFFPQP